MTCNLFFFILKINKVIKTYFLLLLILSTSHLLNDLMQSLIPASYPLLKEKYALLKEP